MPLTVLSVAYPFAPVSQAAVGGAEKILSDLDTALVAHEHHSVVLAPAGSQVAGMLLPVPCPVALNDAERTAARATVQCLLDQACATHAFDVVHLHGIDFHEYRVPAHLPTVVTLHLPVAWYPADIWARWRGTTFIAVSEAQRSTCPAELAHCTVIPNGVDLPPPLDVPRERFALCMGRICPEKNQHAALDAGTLAGMPVLLAGEVYPYEAHQRYFADEIAPRLAAGHSHRMLGPVDAATRNWLLQTAQCLLHPTLASETSSLVAMEALAAGTPVIAYPSGALPGIVEHGVTGLLVDNPAAMAGAMTQAALIASDACRRAAALRFSKARMVGTYLELYASLAQAPKPQELQHA